MKISFFKRKKENEENKLRIAMLENECDKLIKKLSDVKLSKDEKIAELAKEVAYLKETEQIYEERIKIHEEIENSIMQTKKTLSNMNYEAQGKIQSLEDEIFKLKLMIPEKFPVSEIMGKCSDAAWYGQKSEKVFESLDGKTKLFFEGVVYEPSYEFFTAGCCVYYLEDGMEKKKSLYTIDSRNVEAYKNEVVETGSLDNIKQYLAIKNIAFKEI